MPDYKYNPRFAWRFTSVKQRTEFLKIARRRGCSMSALLRMAVDKFFEWDTREQERIRREQTRALMKEAG